MIQAHFAGDKIVSMSNDAFTMYEKSRFGEKKGKRMAIKLSEELIAASKNEGTAVRKREDVQRMAEANKAFAHFAR